MPKSDDVKSSANSPGEDLPAWRETPLDHWTNDIDPAIMAGDEWALNDPGADPGAQRIAQNGGGTVVRERFMHPTHDSNYGLKEDQFREPPQT